jgi:NAD(P)-dependent dehydrogenase (short-subunit alcohol dehydrogenase family)
MELRNKIAIVTGGARGIGRAIALEFAKEGAKVVISDIDIDNCELTCDEIKEIGGMLLQLSVMLQKKER